jgi:hypothetical protein
LISSFFELLGGAGAWQAEGLSLEVGVSAMSQQVFRRTMTSTPANFPVIGFVSQLQLISLLFVLLHEVRAFMTKSVGIAELPNELVLVTLEAVLKPSETDILCRHTLSLSQIQLCCKERAHPPWQVEKMDRVLL